MFDKFLNCPRWLKIASLLSFLWFVGCMFEYSHSKQYETALMAIFPPTIYWGMVWIFPNNIRRVNVIFLSGAVLICISFYAILYINDLKAQEAMKEFDKTIDFSNLPDKDEKLFDLSELPDKHE